MPPASVQSFVPPVTVQMGIYRDGDNNLDAAEGPVIPQAMDASARDPRVRMNVCDTTALNHGVLLTYGYDIAHGLASPARIVEPVNMSNKYVLASFVAETLDQAHQNHAQTTWIELVNHGAGDAGGLFSIGPGGMPVHMTIDDLSDALRLGSELHGRRHPEDAARKIDGILMHECFELTEGVCDALARAGVSYLAASPETTIAPGVPTESVLDISNAVSDPQAMALAMTKRVMTTRYASEGLVYGPAAAFSVLDLRGSKMDAVRRGEQRFNLSALKAIDHDRSVIALLCEDANRVPGMQRDEPGLIVPWRADRPAIVLYATIASDKRLPAPLRHAAGDLAQSLAKMVLAHGETRDAVGFGPSYLDAYGPTTHFPTRTIHIDPLSPEIAETATTWAYQSYRNALISAMLLLPPSKGSASST